MGTTRVAVIAAACGWLVATGMAQTKSTTNLLAAVDHLVYATPDLKASIDALEKRLGVRAAPGGALTAIINSPRGRIELHTAGRIGSKGGAYGAVCNCHRGQRDASDRRVLAC